MVFSVDLREESVICTTFVADPMMGRIILTFSVRNYVREVGGAGCYETMRIDFIHCLHLGGEILFTSHL